MSKVTPKQKAKAEQYIKDNIGPKSYKNNAYGELQMLYDFVKDNDLSKMSDEERSDFFIEISDLKNGLIDWVKNTPQKQYQFENIIFRIKSLYAAFYNIEVFTDIEKNKIELNDAFDFELEPKELKINLLIENAESRILKAINEVESKAEKTSNKSSKKKPKPNFEDFFDERYKHLANKIFDEFKGYEGKNLAMLIHILIEKRIIKTRRNSLSPLRFSELIQNKSIKNNEAVNDHLRNDNNFKIALGKYPDDYLYVEYKVNDIIQ